MSLILPMTQIAPRSAPEPATRTDGTDPVEGTPFRQELIQALGLTDIAATIGGPISSAPPASGAPERLDPLGAALRALLGGETPATESDGTELLTEQLAPAEETEETAEADAGTQQAALTESVPAVALAAELTQAVSMLPLAVAVPDPLAPAASESLPATSDPVTAASVSVSVELPVPAADSLVEAQAVPITVAESLLPEADAAPVPESGSDRSQATKAVAAKGPTFESLVELITGAQANDTARHPMHPGPDASTAQSPERIAERTTQRPSDAAPEGEPEPINPLALKADGPKPAFGQLLTVQAAEPRSVRSTEIPAPALLNQVTRSIRLLAEGARSELQVKLHPAELGEVLVRLTLQDGVLNAQLQTTDAAVKATLDANLDALKARFEQHGLQVNSLAVSTGAGQLTDDGQAKSGWSQPSNQNAGRNRDRAEGDEPEESQEPTTARRILGRRWGRRLDQFA